MDMDMENDRAPRSATAVRTHSEDEGVVQIHDGTDLSKLAVMPGLIEVAVLVDVNEDDDQVEASIQNGALDDLRREAARRKQLKRAQAEGDENAGLGTAKGAAGSPADGGVKGRRFVGLQQLRRIVARSNPPENKAVNKSELSLRETQALAELFFHIRKDDVAKVQAVVKKEKINLHSNLTADWEGKTPLHVAASYNAKNVVEWLVKQGVEVNALDSLYRTPLFIASARDTPEIQQMLIAAQGMIRDPVWAPRGAPQLLPGSMALSDIDASVHWLAPTLLESAEGPAAAGQSDKLDGSGAPREMQREGLNKSFGNLQSGASFRTTGGQPPSGSGAVSRTEEFTQEWELDPNDLIISENKLGTGAFGEVFKGRWQGSTVACKRMKAEFADDATALAELRAELSIWCRLHHPNICHFLGAVTSAPGYPCTLIAELCEKGGLQALLLKHRSQGTFIKWDDGIRYVAGIAAGMCYLHNRKPLAVMHRDLKPANCLIDSNNNIKLTDFGLSKLLAVDKRRVEHTNPYKQRDAPIDLDASVHGQAMPVALQDKTFRMTGETGAYKYMAPEVLRHERYSMKVDVYSFSIVCYEIFEGLIVATDAGAFAKAAASSANARPDCELLKAFNQKRTLAMEKLIQQCWDAFPMYRPDFLAITERVAQIRQMKEWDVPDQAGPSGRSSARRADGTGGGDDKACCVVQ